MSNVIRSYGWLPQHENPGLIDELGGDPDVMMRAMFDSEPTFELDIEPWVTLFWQGSQGACQGHALAHMAQIVFTQHSGIKRFFSRAWAYYESQRHDGIRGDMGSTLAGGARVMADGLGLESDWAYPRRYSNRRPSGFEEMPRLKIPFSKRLTDADQCWAWLQAGGVIQTGVTWNRSLEALFVDRYRSGGMGGHSTICYGFHPDKPDYCVHMNSWKNWQDEGKSYWKKQVFADLLKQRFTVLMGYQVGGFNIDPEIFEMN